MSNSSQQDVRDKLAELVGRFGLDLCNDPKRCKGLLHDVCSEHRREIVALVAAAREGVGSELRHSSDGSPKELVFARLTKRLYETEGMDEGLARWAVESWALALGIASVKDFQLPFTCPKCGVHGRMATKLAGHRSKCPRCGVSLFIADNGREVFLVSEAQTSPATAALASGTLPAKKDASGVVPQWAFIPLPATAIPRSSPSIRGPNLSPPTVTPTPAAQPTAKSPQGVGIHWGVVFMFIVGIISVILRACNAH